MGDFERSIDFALLAGAAFDVHEASEYVETILARTVDRYIEARRKGASIDPVLEAVVEKMVEKCMQAGEVRQVAGIAVEANRMDVLKAVLSCGVDAAYYAAELAMRFVGPSALRNEILALVIAALQASDNPDYVFIADCLTARQDAARCAELLAQLRGTDGALHAQVAYNIVEAASPSTLSQLHADLHAFKAQTDKFRLTFLYRTNASDMLILERTRDALLATSSMHHTALSTANALMHAGTTCDAFLRKNLDWLAQANNWSKFSATASLGVIHRGQRDARALLESYLPAEGVAFGASEYSEGGALFALGLINDDESVQYLRNALDAGSDVVQHGAMLGLGAARMASGDAELGDQLRSILYRDNATSGEAAAFGLGLIYAGHLDVALIDDLLAYAHETQHDKVIRACALAIALTCYGHGDKAEGTLGRMLEDKDALVRHGGAWAVALAYAGTSSNRGIRRLLHLAVSDASDDVRRAAVIGLGLVLFRTPGELPVLLDLLIESYNPHVRYGAAMALGIAFAGTGNAAAIEMIAPLAKDMSDFVRQASHISLALLHQQRLTDASAEHRKSLESTISARYESALSKFGAILGQGIIDAAGRNARVSLAAVSGMPDMRAIIGATLFCQHWHWYPLMHFLAFSLVPTAMLAVDEQGRMPKSVGLALPSDSVAANAYPPPIKPEVVEAPKLVIAAFIHADSCNMIIGCNGHPEHDCQGRGTGGKEKRRPGAGRRHRHGCRQPCLG